MLENINGFIRYDNIKEILLMEENFNYGEIVFFRCRLVQNVEIKGFTSPENNVGCHSCAPNDIEMEWILLFYCIWIFLRNKPLGELDKENGYDKIALMFLIWWPKPMIYHFQLLFACINPPKKNYTFKYDMYINIDHTQVLWIKLFRYGVKAMDFNLIYRKENFHRGKIFSSTSGKVSWLIASMFVDDENLKNVVTSITTDMEDFISPHKSIVADWDKALDI